MGFLRAAAFAPAEAAARNITQGVLDREECGRLVGDGGSDLPERGIIIQDIDAAPERPEDQIVFALLDFEIAHGNRREVRLCTLCHAYAATDEKGTSVDLRNMIHMIHACGKKKKS